MEPLQQPANTSALLSTAELPQPGRGPEVYGLVLVMNNQMAPILFTDEGHPQPGESLRRPIHIISLLPQPWLNPVPEYIPRVNHDSTNPVS